MRCNHCNSPLGNHDLWCVSCGKKTEAIDTDLSAMKSLGNTWSVYKANLTKNIPAASIAVIFGVLPLAIFVWFFRSMLATEAETTLQLLQNLGIQALAAVLFFPMVFLVFSAVNDRADYQIELADIKSAFRRYPAYLCFTLISAVYYVFIYVVCFGLPGFVSDPILRLAWLVLVHYWLAIALPAPTIAETRKVSMLKAIQLSYRHFHDVRWNLYLMALVLGLINLLALVFFVFGLVFTIPLSIFAIRDYTFRLMEYELLDYRR